ncbi:MAG TPA: acetoacetate--CoA ligase, partial [Nitrososphaerales archaeon]|nr:acetoacetate--CoA ligase [Nitrososphaerales archaeon]
MPSGKLLWTPEPSFARKTNIASYMKWLRARGLDFEDYDSLWRWSVEDLEGFWGSIWKYFDVADVDYPVLPNRAMPGARWFEGSELNFAEKLFREKRTGTAIICRGERGGEKTYSWEDLRRKTSALAQTLKGMGVVSGDRVAALLPNSMEAIVAMLASASLGAVWSSCSPDFGAPSVVDRFNQIAPKVLLATDGYYYGGKWYDRSEMVKDVAGAIGSIEKVISAPGRSKGAGIEGTLDWAEATRGKAALDFEQVPFEHPLWVLYSSGTTGLPKAIVHSHGGILVELLKTLSLHNDLGPKDRFFWFTTTGWMMWNYLLGGLLHGATLVLYNGSPTYPSGDALWRLAEETKTTFLGTSAAHLTSCARGGMDPGSNYDLSALRGIGSTGSPLPSESFEWAYAHVKEDLWLASVSGGTDVCTGFVGGCPILPVYSGEIQCRCLGAKVEAFDESGTPVIGKVGELVVTEPMPSMPIYFWGDEDGRKYSSSYFEKY